MRMYTQCQVVRTAGGRRSAGTHSKILLLRALVLAASPGFIGNLAARDDCSWSLSSGIQTGNWCPPKPQCEAQGAQCRPGPITIFGIPLWCVCPCRDPQIQASLRSTAPILSFPSITTFVPAGNLRIEGLEGVGTLTAAAEGSLVVRLDLNNQLMPPSVVATIEKMALRIKGLPVENASPVNLARNLPISVPGFPFQPFIGFSRTAVPESSLLLVDPVNGSTIGVLGSLFSTPQESFSFKGDVRGILNFASGLWSLRVSGPQCRLEFRLCDINLDGKVDRSDLNLIFSARNTRVHAPDARDVDGDGLITVNDVRICTLACTKPLCML